MKVHSTHQIGSSGVVYWFGDLTPQDAALDVELNRVGARTVLMAEMNGKELEVFLDGGKKIVAALLHRSFVSADWLAEFERQFRKQIAA